MGQQDVLGHRHHGGIAVVLKGCVDARHQTQPAEHLGLIEGDPVVHLAAEGLGNHLHIGREPLHDFRVLPSALAVKGGG